MTSVREVILWLNTLDSESSVAVDEGGLTLIEISADHTPTESYFEVGGFEEYSEHYLQVWRGWRNWALTLGFSQSQARCVADVQAEDHYGVEPDMRTHSFPEPRILS